MTGRNDAGTIVDFKAGPETAGQFLNIKITEALKFSLLGELETEQ
jgi:tRNA A37 methylthiotransferase MiaB